MDSGSRAGRFLQHPHGFRGVLAGTVAAVRPVSSVGRRFNHFGSGSLHTLALAHSPSNSAFGVWFCFLRRVMDVTASCVDSILDKLGFAQRAPRTLCPIPPSVIARESSWLSHRFGLACVFF